MNKYITYSTKFCLVVLVLIAVQLACLSTTVFPHQLDDQDLTEERIKECLVEKADLGFKIQGPEWKTSSSGKKTSCTANISIIAPEEYSLMIKKSVTSSTGGDESSQWTKSWELLSAGKSADLGEIYYFEHHKEDGTYTEYRYIEKIIAVRIEPGCEDAAQAIPDDELLSDESDLIRIPNPCQ